MTLLMTIVGLLMCWILGQVLLPIISVILYFLGPVIIAAFMLVIGGVIIGYFKGKGGSDK